MPRCRAFRVPKRGHDLAECQDACAIGVGRVAVADGAAESANAGLWARMLVEEFVAVREELAWPGWIAGVQSRFADAVRRPTDAEPLPWYLEGRYDQGAFATFLGLSFGARSWQAVAVGDSCLFQVRDDRVQIVFPLEHSSRFDSTPWLIGSHTSPEEVPRRKGMHLLGESQSGDRHWLMTDALARWFLTCLEAGERPWRDLDPLLDAPDEAFVHLVDRLRDRRLLRNDDTTLVAVWL